MGKFTSTDAADKGRAGGLASAEARRASKALAADLKARQKFEDAAEELAQALLDAALGRGSFDGLDPAERVKYIVKALEYGVGRPRQLDRADPDETPEEPTEGVAFAVGGTDEPETARGAGPEEAGGEVE